MNTTKNMNNTSTAFYCSLLCLVLGLGFFAKLIGTPTLSEDDMIALGILQIVVGLAFAFGVASLLWYFRNKRSAIVVGALLYAGLMTATMLNWTDVVTTFTHGLLH